MRSDLRLSDLEAGKARVPEKLMNTQIPEHTMNAIDEMAEALQCSKAAAVIALLNEGLAIFEKRRHEFPTPSARRPRRGRPRRADS